MLVLTRRVYDPQQLTEPDDRQNQIVVVLPDGKRIVFSILPNKHGNTKQVKVGIDAPPDVLILRGELDRQLNDTPPPRTPRGEHQ